MHILIRLNSDQVLQFNYQSDAHAHFTINDLT